MFDFAEKENAHLYCGMSGLMTLFVTFLVIVAVVYSIKFTEPSKVSTVIEQLKEEMTKQNMKIDQLKVENNQLKTRNDDLEEKLWEQQKIVQKCHINQEENEKEQLKKQIDVLQKELSKLKEMQKPGFVEIAFNWLTSAFSSMKKNVEHTMYSIIWKKMYEYISILLL